MFDLEPAIAEWRQNMLAAGITTPIPLEELELHLREEIERQRQTGLAAPQAFALAVQRIGEAPTLKAEFQKAGTISGFNHRRIYHAALAAFALYVAIETLSWVRQPLIISPFVGPISLFWYGLAKALAAPETFPFIFNGPQWPPFSVILWLFLLNYLYVGAMAATLIARRYRPQQSAWLGRLLNWALLPALPWGPLIGLYGLWCDEMENAGEAPKSWLGKFFAFAMTPLRDRDTHVFKRLLAAILQITGGVAIGIVGCSMLIWILFGLGMILFVEAGFIRMPSATLYLLSGATPLLVNLWMLFCVFRIVRSLRTQPKPDQSHV
jgi:hypothetical protein